MNSAAERALDGHSRGRGEAGPSTAMAHGVWFTEQAAVAGTAYHMALGIWFDGVLDRRALDEACVAVVARHDVLGCAVDVNGDVPRYVPAAEKVTLAEAGYSEGRVREEITRPYDLSRGPLARFTLLRDTPTRHLLLFTAHHLVFDGASKDILVRDLATAYGGAELGPLPSAAPDVPDIGAARTYWAEHWAAPGDVRLPDLSRIPIAAEPGRTVEFSLPHVRLDGLTRFEVLLASIHVLLARYGNPGLPTSIGLSTRTRETRDHIGLFVNELPVSAAPAHGTFREYAHALRARLRELYRHRGVPLGRAVSGLRPAAALTPVSVGYRRRGGEPGFAGLRASVQWALFSGSARNALHIQIVDSPGGLSFGLQYSPSAISTAGVTRFGEHLRTVLETVTADPDTDVATMPIMPTAELESVLHAWNQTARPCEGVLPDHFAVHAARCPDEVAVVDGTHWLTYAELDAASAEFARRLPPGRLVALRMPRGWQAVVAMLAAMRRGTPYVPVDPSYPVARQQLILEDADPALIIDGLDAVTSTGSASDAVADAVYVMYTSGSTGRPKGVVVPPSALANLVQGMAEVIGSRPGDRWLGLTPLSFDISGLELFLPLATGGRLVIAGQTGGLDGRAVTDIIRTEGVTHVQATPSGWRVLLDAGFNGPAVTAMAGGEALPLDLARRLRSCVARLINVYGPTETTIWSTADEIFEQPDEVTIGRPIANTQAYIVDGFGRPLPVGVWGELWLGGHGVATGYLREPELTARRFILNPFGPGRVYRTGDLCRWTSGGRILFGGRSDTQVKIRGHRIELEEIETRLREHPAVAQAAVALRGDQLAGYIVAHGAPPDPAALREHVAETLPAAMVPALWSVLDRLPVTPSGKLDRAALPDPAPWRASSTMEPGREDDITRTVREIWQEVLSIDDIGPDEDLFDLGGHSLTITRISARIVQQLGVEVPLDVFFDTPTIAEIAQHIKEVM